MDAVPFCLTFADRQSIVDGISASGRVRCWTTLDVRGGFYLADFPKHRGALRAGLLDCWNCCLERETYQGVAVSLG